MDLKKRVSDLLEEIDDIPNAAEQYRENAIIEALGEAVECLELVIDPDSGKEPAPKPNPKAGGGKAAGKAKKPATAA